MLERGTIIRCGYDGIILEYVAHLRHDLGGGPAYLIWWRLADTSGGVRSEIYKYDATDALCCLENTGDSWKGGLQWIAADKVHQWAESPVGKS